MLNITRYASSDSLHTDTLTLPYELRQKARLLAQLDSGQEVGLQLERGKVLRGGDKLLADNDSVIKIVAAPETVSTVTAGDALLLARICYHLGNRHVPLQVGDGWCRYLHDHVLDDMVTQLGATVNCEQAEFEPESGAYHSHSGDKQSSHGHSHSGHSNSGHSHSHD